MADLSEIKQKVETSTEVMMSAKILIEGLTEKIKSCGTDQAAIDDLVKTLESETAKLSEAVAANTPQ